MRWRWLTAIGGVLLVAAAIAAALVSRQKTAVPQTPPRIVAVSREIVLTGTVQAQHTVAVNAPVDGTIDRFLVDAGDTVYEGQVLATITNSRLASAAQAAQADAEQAQSLINELQSASLSARLAASESRATAVRAKLDYEQAEKAYTRQQLLMNEGVTPRLIFEKAEKDYTQAKTDFQSEDALARAAEDRLSTLEKQLESARSQFGAKNQDAENTNTKLAAGEVHSPIGGVIVARNGNPGDAVSPALRNLLEIATDMSALMVSANAPADQLRLLKPEQTAIVQLADVPGENVPATVSFVDNSRVVVSFQNPSPAAIRPGMAAQVHLPIGPR